MTNCDSIPCLPQVRMQTKNAVCFVWSAVRCEVGLRAGRQGSWKDGQMVKWWSYPGCSPKSDRTSELGDPTLPESE